mmetsp:Transcript_30861/g.73504  ORF Transcript_30861/g.73504 Transcript_30861/m.73504 type:complete len:302 (+) Transcript_30861:351-1256(+)
MSTWSRPSLVRALRRLGNPRPEMASETSTLVSDTVAGCETSICHAWRQASLSLGSSRRDPPSPTSAWKSWTRSMGFSCAAGSRAADASPRATEGSAPTTAMDQSTSTASLGWKSAALDAASLAAASTSSRARGLLWPTAAKACDSMLRLRGWKSAIRGAATAARRSKSSKDDCWDAANAHASVAQARGEPSPRRPSSASPASASAPGSAFPEAARDHRSVAASPTPSSRARAGAEARTAANAPWPSSPQTASAQAMRTSSAGRNSPGAAAALSAAAAAVAGASPAPSAAQAQATLVRLCAL